MINLIDGEICEFDSLLGYTFSNVYAEENAVIFEIDKNKQFCLEHIQDCCEDVYIESIVGDLSDLIDSEILLAEEAYEEDESASEHGSWSFYKLATIKGYVDIRFYGSSNGYYSESACLIYREL